MNQQSLSAFIWGVADLLRGDYKSADYGKVILPFTVLRRLDCVLAPTKAAVLEERRRTALIELAEGHFLDELHQLGDAFGEQLEDEIAERRFGQQGLEIGVRQNQQRGFGFGDAAGVVGRLAEQAGR